ncbi:MAG: MCE family protein [Gemmatimonadaceae bacterium]|nr:MCE family protein [Gemmatimonadaceae bacterium]
MKKRDEVLVGILITAALAVAIVGSLWLARGGLSKGYPLYAKFPWGAGLKQGQPVLLVGVNVGYVDKVELNQNGTLVTTMRIVDDYRVPDGSSARVVANGIFGDMAIALTPIKPNPVAFKSGDTIPVGPSAPGLSEITAKADSVGTSVNALTREMERELVAGGGIRDMRKALAGTNRLIAQLAVVAAEQNRQLTATQEAVRRATTAVDPAKIDSTVTNLRAASANMATLTNDMKATTARIDSILAKVDNGNGTVAKLLNDPGIYNDVRKLLQRVDSLTLDFKANPRKYINLKIF